jgi:hypothetical protein
MQSNNIEFLNTRTAGDITTFSKATFLRRKEHTILAAENYLGVLRDRLAEMPDDADIRRFREKAEVCLLKVQELRAEMAELVEKLEANRE